MKRFFITIAVVIIALSLSACGSDPTPHESAAPVQNETSEATQNDPRLVEFEINNSVMEVLSLDDDTIKLLDEVYIASSEAYITLSAHQFVSEVYDTVVAFNDRFTEELGKIEKPTDEERHFLLEVTENYSLELPTILGAGLEYAEGNISAEQAAFETLVGVDCILNYMYQDYVAIYQPRFFDVDSIYGMYEENELAAEESFKNQLLCVSGTVYEVARDVMDRPYVGLATNRELAYELLRCYTDSIQNEDIISLKKGDRVTCVIQITDKDTFNVNAVLWDISPFSDSEAMDNEDKDIRESLRNSYPNDYNGAKEEFQKMHPNETFRDEYYFTDYECQVIRDFEENYNLRILRETYEDGWVNVESLTGEVGDECVYIGENDPWE